MSENIIGYFLAYSKNKRNIRVLVEIEIPLGAKTNLNRSNIYDKLNAEYKTNNYIVKKIYDREMNEYSLFYIDYYFSREIKLGENVSIKNDITNIENSDEELKVEAQTFYLTKKRAVGNENNNNTYISYHKNGNKYEEYSLKNGKKNGKYYKWLSNGKLCEDLNYLDNKLNGECKFYDGKTGKLEDHSLYENGCLIEYLDIEITKKN